MTLGDAIDKHHRLITLCLAVVALIATVISIYCVRSFYRERIQYDSFQAIVSGNRAEVIRLSDECKEIRDCISSFKKDIQVLPASTSNAQKQSITNRISHLERRVSEHDEKLHALREYFEDK